MASVALVGCCQSSNKFLQMKVTKGQDAISFGILQAVSEVVLYPRKTMREVALYTLRSDAASPR